MNWCLMQRYIAYPYKPKLYLTLVSTGILLVGALFLSYIVAYENISIVFGNFIKFDPEGSKFGLLLAALWLFGLVAYGLMAVRASLMPDRNIVFATDHVSIPNSLLFDSVIEISFSEIKCLSLQAQRHSRILHVHHASGIFKVRQRFFKDRLQFDHFLIRLQVASAARGCGVKHERTYE